MHLEQLFDWTAEFRTPLTEWTRDRADAIVRQ